MMILRNFPVLVVAAIYCADGQAHAQQRRRCAYGNSCWPDAQTWNDFNATIGGRLIRSVPIASVCHSKRYNADQCAAVNESWWDSPWRTSQPGGYSATLWGTGETGHCSIDTPISAPCDQGIVPYYAVNATGVEDIQKSVQFASEKDLFLVTKNTGHDHLGRSSGQGAFSIWTHNLKGMEWHESFVPKGAPAEVSGIPAVTLKAGEQWIDVYQQAAERGVLVVGGSARTVGAAGGYLLGGGHSPFAHYHGLAADNLVEATIVSADGRHRVVNSFLDPEFFWAIRGGGGSAWGILTSVTYKTHAVPENLIIGLVQLNSSSDASYKHVVGEALKSLPAVTDAGYTGYGMMSDGFGAIFIQPNGSVASFNETFAPFFDLAQVADVSGVVAAYPSTWDGYVKDFLRDPNIGTNNQDASRLLTSDVIKEKSRDLVELIFENRQGAGFNFIGKVNNDERDHTAVNNIWKESHALMSLSVDWEDSATEREKQLKKQKLVRFSERLTDIVGEGGGTYINEANPYEPQWEKVFWGDKYDRLLSIKQNIDPTHLFVCNRCVGTDLVLQP